MRLLGRGTSSHDICSMRESWLCLPLLEARPRIPGCSPHFTFKDDSLSSNFFGFLNAENLVCLSVYQPVCVSVGLSVPRLSRPAKVKGVVERDVDVGKAVSEHVNVVSVFVLVYLVKLQESIRYMRGKHQYISDSRICN